MAEVLLDIKGLEKTFPGVRALKGVNLTVNKGEIHALMGENGAGKSTLIKVLTGIYQKNGGTICFDGEEINARTPIEANEKGISTIYQELNLVLFQTVYENLFLGREPRTKFGSIDRKAMISEAKRILEELGIEIDVTRPLKNYSTAIQQMVAIARAVSINAKLVIMDEPTSSLDTHEVQVLFRIIRQLKSKGISVICISHKLDEIFEICDRLTVFKDGEYVGDYDIGELNQLKLISLMVGKDTVELERNKQGYEFANAKVIAEMKDIRQGMRLNGINIEIKQGEVVGLAGLLGVGRDDHGHAGDKAHQADVLDRLVAAAVLTHGHTGVGAADLHVEPGIGDGVADLFICPACTEHSKRRAEGNQTHGGQARADIHHICLSDTAVEEALRMRGLEMLGHGGASQVCVQHHDLVVDVAQLGQSLAVCLAGRDFFTHGLSPPIPSKPAAAAPGWEPCRASPPGSP